MIIGNHLRAGTMNFCTDKIHHYCPHQNPHKQTGNVNLTIFSVFWSYSGHDITKQGLFRKYTEPVWKSQEQKKWVDFMPWFSKGISRGIYRGTNKYFPEPLWPFGRQADSFIIAPGPAVTLFILSLTIRRNSKWHQIGQNTSIYFFKV